MCISSSCRRLDSPAGVEYKGTAAVGSELHHATKKSDESAFLDVKVSLWNVISIRQWSIPSSLA